MTHGSDPGTGPVPRPGPGTAVFAAPVTTAERLADGSLVLRSGIPLQPYGTSMAGLFRAAADAHPDRVLVAQRDADGWRKVTYREAREPGRRAGPGTARSRLRRRGPGDDLVG